MVTKDIHGIAEKPISWAITLHFLNTHHKQITSLKINKNKTLIPPTKCWYNKQQKETFQKHDAWQGFSKTTILAQITEIMYKYGASSGKSITEFISETGKIKKIYYHVTEAYSEPCQTSKMEHFGKIVDGF